jgi:PPOX class probable F420-dependent enzyme
VQLTDAALDLLGRASPGVLTTLLPDGSPHSTEVWVDADGDQVLVNSVDTHRKVRNVRRDPRVALVVIDPENGSRHVALRGRVVEVTREGARDHIEKLALRYLGGPYPWFGGRDQTRVLLRIDVDWLGGQLR